ncbi:MAG: hypothetical protein Q9228_005276, partial [Teloschistes exilis]
DDGAEYQLLEWAASGARCSPFTLVFTLVLALGPLVPVSRESLGSRYGGWLQAWTTE